MREFEASGGLECPEMRAAVQGASGLRLMVSGSMSLPIPILDKWREMTGHTLLERYGMSELGMALSQSLNGERVAGTVGLPLPTVEIKLVNSDDDDHDDEGQIEVKEPNKDGELYVRGPGVFNRYFRRDTETKEAFSDGWFKTGDIASRNEQGLYSILGRASVDIIKSGGYKISALEVERVLLEIPEVEEAFAVGVHDDVFGQAIGEALSLLREWAKDRLAPYKLPVHARSVDSIPKNAMGKVNKKELCKIFV
jgi:malonyl-CoA/methylmalonyl-CoA synthetase